MKRKIKQFLSILQKSLILPKVVERNKKAQEQVNKMCENLKLYQTNACPYCLKVRFKIKELGLNIELVNINEEKHYEELLQYGGKTQVPCLKILSNQSDENSNDKWVYESSVINRYLDENFKLFTHL